MTLFALGMLVIMVATLIESLLGDEHPAAVVKGLPWWKALYTIRPSPLRVAYGLPMGLLAAALHGPFYLALPLAAGLALVYEYFGEQKRGLTPFGRMETEDVRDVVAGTIIGLLLSLVF